MIRQAAALKSVTHTDEEHGSVQLVLPPDFRFSFYTQISKYQRIQPRLRPPLYQQQLQYADCSKRGPYAHWGRKGFVSKSLHDVRQGRCVTWLLELANGCLVRPVISRQELTVGGGVGEAASTGTTASRGAFACQLQSSISVSV